MVSSSIRYFKALSKNNLIKNSSWGIVSQVVQAVFMSLFFVIIARQYPIKEFATYIIATALYQIMTVLSTLGLSQWFIRELASSEKKKYITNAFFKLQFYVGFFFFLLNVIVAKYLYNDSLILQLSIIFGANIVLDNIINAIKCLNIVEFNQKKTFQIVTIEALLKFSVSCLLFITTFSIVKLSFFLIVVRLLSLNLFLKLGTSDLIDVKSMLQHRISIVEVRRLIFQNWPFIIIGGVSILNWRIASIIISKILTETDIANYEVSYKLFSIAQIIPVAISATVFPKLVRYYKDDFENSFRAFYRKAFSIYFGFGLISFACVAISSPILIPIFFGSNFNGTHIYATQMFFSMLLFPTVFLQANVLVAMKKEKLDMWLNVIALMFNLAICLIGLQNFKSLVTVNIAIFCSLFVFHILQDIILISKKVTTIKQVMLFYFLLLSVILCFYFTKGVSLFSVYLP